MPKNRKVSTLDGYATLKAAARASKAPEKPRPAAAHAPPSAPPAAPAGLQKLGAHLTRTVMPARRVIECYECGYKFQLHGRAANINCSKCRATLDLTDHTIAGERSETLKTAGTIRLAPTGILKAGELVGNDVVLEGSVEGGTVRAMRTLELGQNAIFSEKAVRAPNLKIAQGAFITFNQVARYRDVEVLGTLKASLRACGVITIRAGGLLMGDVHAQHLVVEDGGGLKATLEITSAATAGDIPEATEPRDPFPATPQSPAPPRWRPQASS